MCLNADEIDHIYVVVKLGVDLRITTMKAWDIFIGLTSLSAFWCCIKSKL